MPKAEVGSPKWLANKMKSKGLQKLRWFCQMCQKQCRDENGFRCHINSESHQRQLLVVADNPKQFLGEFSHEFERNFVDLLRRRFGTKRVQANLVYQEYIADKQHVHMNATRWETLTGFINYLGRTGKCIVDHTEKGWFLTYIDRDPETLKHQEQLAKKQKMDKDDEERMMEFVKTQVEKAAKEGQPSNLEEGKTYTELIRDSEDQKVEFVLPKISAVKDSSVTPLPKFALPALKRVAESELGIPSSSKKSHTDKSSKSSSALDEIRQEEERRREKMNRKDYWLHKGIIVKIATKKLGDKYNKQKAIVEDVEDQYTGIVRLLDSKEKLKLDQAHLQTVIPALDKEVLVVNGAYRGLRAVLVALDEKNFCVSVRISEGTLHGRVVEGVQYEDVCKLASSDGKE